MASRVIVTPRIDLQEAHRTIATGNEPPEDGKFRTSDSIPAFSLQCGQMPCNGIPIIDQSSFNTLGRSSRNTTLQVVFFAVRSNWNYQEGYPLIA